MRTRAKWGVSPRSERPQPAPKDGLRQTDVDHGGRLQGKSVQTKPSPTGRACSKTHVGGAPERHWKVPRSTLGLCYVMVCLEIFLWGSLVCNFSSHTGFFLLHRGVEAPLFMHLNSLLSFGIAKCSSYFAMLRCMFFAFASLLNFRFFDF